MSEQANPQGEHHDSDSAWWNPLRWPTGIWALVIGGMLMLLPFCIRALVLLNVPSISEPFDVAQFSKWDVPEGEDGFTDYRRARVLHQKIAEGFLANGRREPDSISAVMESGWSASDDASIEWLDAYAEALAVWRHGTEKAQGLHERPDKLAVDSNISVIQDQRFFCRLALCQQARLQSESKLQEGYEWARAAFRCGGHVSHRACLVQSLVGSVGHAMACRGIQRWAEQPAVTREQLQQALVATRADYSLYERRSNILKAEYLAFRNSFASSRWLQVTTTTPSSVGNSVAAELMRMGYWVVGEPELSTRLLRQMLANQIHEIDKPVGERRKSVGTGLAMLFDPDPSIPLMPGQLDPVGIDRGLKRSSVLLVLTPALKRVDTVLLRQEARQRTLEAMLALQAYRRGHAEFPESLLMLVPDYLDAVPLDPLDPMGGPIRYRRDSAVEATVWSIGDDSVDGGGEVNLPTNQPADVGFTLR